jgi:phage/plasmid-like protein (TIGR03299 family)
MTKQERVFETLQSTETNWTVSKEPLIATKVTDDGIIELPTETFGLFRSDNNGWLGSVGNRYEAMQNFELADTIVGIQDMFGGDIRGGEMRGGKKIYYQLSLKDEHVGADTLKRHITCLNSHDGTSSIGFGSTNTVVSCSNTFHHAMRDLSKFRHTASASERLAMAVEEFKRAMDADEQLMERFKRFTEVKLDPTILERVMSNIFNVDMKAKQSEVSTRKVNQITNFEKALAKETSEKGSTLWGLFNSVTYYTNHLEKSKADEHHLMFGSGYKKNLKAFNIIDQYENDKRVLVHA